MNMRFPSLPFPISRRLALCCIPALLVVDAYSREASEAAVRPPAPTAIQELGEHWSGLDRALLAAELERGDSDAAAARIAKAAAGSERENADYHILAELLTTDLFFEHREALKAICKEVLAESERARPEGASGEARNERALARSLIYERVLHDRIAAERGYRAILKDRLRDGQSAEEIESSADPEIAPAERAAARRLARLEASKGRQTDVSEPAAARE